MHSHVVSACIKQIYIKKLIPAIMFICFICIIIFYYPFERVIIPPRLNTISSLFDYYNKGEAFLELTVPKLYYTGYDCVKGSDIKGSYYYAFIDNKCVFFLISDDTCKGEDILNNVTIKSKLIIDKQNRDFLITNFSADLKWSKSELDKLSSKFIVSEPDYFVPQAYALLLFIVVTALYSLTYIFIYIAFILFPHMSPMLRHFENSGRAREMLNNADYEFKNSRYSYAADITITANFLVQIKKNNIEIIPLNKIKWIYKHSTMNMITGITYTLVIHTENAVTKIRHLTKFDADLVIDYIEHNYSNILIGYSHKNKLDYKTFIRKKKSFI